MQAQIQALIVKGAEASREVEESNIGSHMEVAKPPILNRKAGRVGEFVMMKMREIIVEEQV